MLAESQSPLLQQLRLHWTCPLSDSPVSDPVLTTLGNTYDRKSLEKWFKTNDLDPVSKTKLVYPHPIPNVALRNVIQLLETQLPKVHIELVQNRVTIKDLSEKVAAIKEIIAQKNLHDEESEDPFFGTTEKSKKIKKEKSPIREQESPKLKQALAQNQKYRQLISDLREKEISYKEQIQLQEKQIQEIKQQLDHISQTAAITQNDLSLFKLWSNAQDKALNKLQSFAKDYFQMMHVYNEEFMNEILKNHKSILNGTLNLKGGDIVEYTDATLKNKLWASMEIQRANPLKNPQITQSFQHYEKMIEFARIQTFMRKTAKKNILSWTTIPDNIHCAIYSSLSLKMIPFSCPATAEELMVDWNQVIEIHSEANTPVSQDQWNELMANMEKFPRLIHLIIDECRFSQITVEDLSKLKKLEKIYFNKGNFKDCEKILQEFQQKNSWIDMKWRHVQ